MVLQTRDSYRLSSAVKIYDITEKAGPTPVEEVSKIHCVD